MSSLLQCYQEITLLPSDEIPCNFLWEKVFQQVHLALVETKTCSSGLGNGSSQVGDYSEYGLSFPKYDQQLNALGCKLRVFADNESKLASLDLQRWLDRLLDYCRLSAMDTVPQGFGHARFSRRQLIGNIKKLARRRAKRKQESYEQALEYYQGLKPKCTRLPYIHVNSLSGQRRFPLFIGFDMAEEYQEGKFSCYGLSSTATVPWFD